MRAAIGLFNGITYYAYGSQSWMIGHNTTSHTDSMARAYHSCGNQVRRGHNFAQYWWQDGSYPADGDQDSKVQILY